jgi:glycosyltransferase involved in cell wall biosynthesis
LPIPHAPEAIWEQVLLPRWLRLKRIDVYHRASGAGGLALRRLAGCHMVVTVHDLIPVLYPTDYFRNPAHRLYFSMLLSLSRRADAVITVSETSKRDLVAVGHFDASKVTVITEGVDRDFLSAPAADPPAPLTDAPYLLAMGSGEPRKNVDRVIEGFLRIVDRIPHRLLVVGSPWRGRDIRVPAGTAVAGRIQALGAVTNPELRQLYEHAAAFVYPSLYEGFGLPVLEAMACGTPVITSREGSLAEIAGPAALYVDPRDPGSIARAIVDLLANPARRAELIVAGHERAGRFSWETAARQTIVVYERAAGSAIRH